jgi:hypothetical protein
MAIWPWTSPPRSWHEAEVAELGSKLAWVKPTLATHVTYDETKDLQRLLARAGPSPALKRRLHGRNLDRMTEIAEILDAPDVTAMMSKHWRRNTMRSIPSMTGLPTPTC